MPDNHENPQATAKIRRRPPQEVAPDAAPVAAKDDPLASEGLADPLQDPLAATQLSGGFVQFDGKEGGKGEPPPDPGAGDPAAQAKAKVDAHLIATDVYLAGLAGMPNLAQAGLDKLDHGSIRTAALNTINQSKLAEDKLKLARGDVGSARAQVGDDKAAKASLARLDGRIKAASDRVDKAMFQVALNLTAQKYQGVTFRGHVSGQGLKPGSVGEATLRSKMVGALGLVSEAKKVKGLLPSVPKTMDTEKLKSNPSLLKIQEVLKHNKGVRHLFLLEVVKHVNIHAYGAISAGQSQARTEAKASEKGVSRTDLRAVEEDARAIIKELDSFTHASDEKISRIVDRHHGKSREYLFSILRDRGYYHKMFARGNAKKLDEQRQDAGEFKKDSIGKDEVARKKSVTYDPTNLAGLGGATAEIASDAARSLGPATCNFAGAFYEGLGDIPLVGPALGQAGKNLKELGSEWDRSLGNNEHFGADMMKYRKVITSSFGQLEADLFKVAVGRKWANVDAGQDLFERIQTCRDQFQVYDAGIKITNELIGGFAAIDNLDTLGKSGGDAKAVRKEAADRLRAITNTVVDLAVGKANKGTKAAGIASDKSKKLSIDKKAYMEKAYSEDKKFMDASTEIASLQKKLGVAVANNDLAAVEKTKNDMITQKGVLLDRAAVIKKENDEAFKRTVEEATATIKLMNDEDKYRRFAVAMLGLALKKILGSVINQLLQTQVKVNVSLMLQAVPTSVYAGTKDMMKTAIKEVAKKIKSGGVAEAFGKFGATLLVEGADASWGQQAEALMKAHLGKYTKEIGDFINEWLAKNGGVANAVLDTTQSSKATKDAQDRAKDLVDGQVGKRIGGIETIK